MIKIERDRLVWLCLAALALLYPISVFAASVVTSKLALPAPFHLEWIGVWFFAIGGGVCAAFVKMEQIDKRFYHPAIAKFLIGIFSGVAISLFIETFINTRMGFLTFGALFASLFSAPTAAGVMAWLSNQKRIDKALDGYYKQKTGTDISLDDEETR